MNPPRQRDALVLAAALRDYVEIDRITDELVSLGLVRPRSDCAWMTRAEIIGKLQGPRPR